ncbi:MAG: hypothetical protein JWM59_2118 [Verrucomicrobiales bacterium]|nr:hypothetical protein [Verrucomicrobiales bacterium]
MVSPAMIEAPSTPMPVACNWPKSVVESIAVQTAELLKYEPRDSMEPLVARLGGKIELLSREDWLAHNHSTITVEGPQDFTIRLMWSDGPLRHRFTIAHELGHYFLHSRQGRIPLHLGRDGSNNRLEWEANWFAAAFLMPEEKFRATAEIYGADPLRLAGQFLVSVEAAKVRLETLKLV